MLSAIPHRAYAQLYHFGTPLSSHRCEDPGYAISAVLGVAAIGFMVFALERKGDRRVGKVYAASLTLASAAAALVLYIHPLDTRGEIEGEMSRIYPSRCLRDPFDRH